MLQMLRQALSDAPITTVRSCERNHVLENSLFQLRGLVRQVGRDNLYGAQLSSVCKPDRSIGADLGAIEPEDFK
jgi:hypothetical protein